MNLLNKREIILNALKELLKEGKGGTASVSEIAKKAGIAKGGLYYYFRSKEEVLDALVDREYREISKICTNLVNKSQGTALDKLALLFCSYRASIIDVSINQYLHLPENAAIHQKSLAEILRRISPTISQLIKQGIEENLFICAYPKEYAEIIMSVFTFLLDPTIFQNSEEEYERKLRALADLVEKGLCAPKGSLSFLYDYL